MAENVYEGMYILDSNRYGRDPEGMSGQIEKLVGEVGGNMLVSRLWEDRRLAYPIKGLRKGTYWLTYFRLDSLKLAELRQKVQLQGGILRVLYLKVDPRIVDTLVAHATGTTIEKDEKDKKTEEAVAADQPATDAPEVVEKSK